MLQSETQRERLFRKFIPSFFLFPSAFFFFPLDQKKKRERNDPLSFDFSSSATSTVSQTRLTLLSIVCLQSLRNMMTTNATDACETRDPCQHGGICISTDSGPICECRSGDYEGAYCEKGELFYMRKHRSCVCARADILVSGNGTDRSPVSILIFVEAKLFVPIWRVRSIFR